MGLDVAKWCAHITHKAGEKHKTAAKTNWNHHRVSTTTYARLRGFETNEVMKRGCRGDEGKTESSSRGRKEEGRFVEKLPIK